jgi:hypothetical protein
MSYIISKFPSSFPSKDNHIWTCGMYTLKAIIEWFNDGQITHYKNYASGWFSKMTWYMLPFWLIKVLKHHWLWIQTISCRLMRRSKKIEKIKELLHKGPVILLISHAYTSKRDFSFRRALTLQHYISLWWYDDEKCVFYVYDSNTEKTHYKGSMPVGNICLWYDKLLWYRRLGGRWLYRNFGIAVDYELS